MKSTRRVGALSVALLVVGNIAICVVLSVVRNFDCTHDFHRMFCDFDAPTCSGYNLTLRCLSFEDSVSCIFKQCDRGKCCCSTKMSLIYGEDHNATVWKGAENVASKIISIADNFKPRVPTNVTVEESNGNFKVTWSLNMDHRPSVRDDLKAIVTYRIKGDTPQVSETFQPTTVNGLRYYEINGEHLKPSTTYLVSVRSVYWNNRSSDSSEEAEFTTSMSPDVLPVAIIVSLSIAAIILSGTIYGCYAKAKTMWWDSVAKCPNPRLLNMHPRKEDVLKPVRPVLSPISVEPLISDNSKSWSEGSLHDDSSGSLQQSSGFSTGSSCTSYSITEPVDIVAGVEEALRKAFPNISQISPLTSSPPQEMNPEIGLFSSPYNLCDVRAYDVNSGSSGFDRKTHSILIPNLPHPTLLESSEVQMQCDSAYHPSQGDIVSCADQQVQACLLITFPPAASSLMPMDMSYQQCNSDSGRFSCAEDSGLSSSSSGTNPIVSCDPAFRVENGCEKSVEVVGDAAKLNGTHEVAIKCDENPCYGCVPAVSRSFPPVSDDYQAFQNLVGQPDILFTEQQSGEEEEHLDKYPEESISEMPEISLTQAVPGFINSVQGAKCLPELDRPLLSLLSAGQSMPAFTEGGYQSV
ncbi:uncharacterized protein LOC115580076 [Sparus aurata]|uniref:Uncharacterized LOC115580074 n=1 Tax=Sparus aurata TaxID=8175 RepID=A0A671VBT5_SPAAU|nr:uncharacterized protein LOC115580076 [Sparus aurata]